MESPPKPENPFIRLNFRGTKRLVRKDTLEVLPFLYAMVNGEWKQNNPVDEDGYYLVDENIETIFTLVDLYRAWMELGEPDGLDKVALLKKVSRAILASTARRLGCETEFVEALLNSHETPDESELFNCYYCGKTFIKGERHIRLPCEYHKLSCTCRPGSSFKCARVPYHTPVPLAIAEKRKRKKVYADQFNAFDANDNAFAFNANVNENGGAMSDEDDVE